MRVQESNAQRANQTRNWGHVSCTCKWFAALGEKVLAYGAEKTWTWLFEPTVSERLCCLTEFVEVLMDVLNPATPGPVCGWGVPLTRSALLLLYHHRSAPQAVCFKGRLSGSPITTSGVSAEPGENLEGSKCRNTQKV